MSDSDDAPIHRELAGLVTDWVADKRRRYRLARGKPQTWVEGMGSRGGYSFSSQKIDHGSLKTVRNIREGGGMIAQLYHMKALIRFGTGVELQSEDPDVENWLEEQLPDIDELILDLGEDAIWYPYAAAEIVETQGGDFSHIEPIEPWTLEPETDDTGEIIGWEQRMSYGKTQWIQTDEIGHIIINKNSARDKTGICRELNISFHSCCLKFTRYIKFSLIFLCGFHLYGFPME